MTLHPDELTDGYRRRIRKSGKCPDKSKVIEKISQQQEKRAKRRPKSKAGFTLTDALDQLCSCPRLPILRFRGWHGMLQLEANSIKTSER